MKYLKPLLLLFIFSPAITSAQKKELINSGELIKKCEALYDSSKYREALPLLEKVNRSDTNYVWCLYEKCINLEADSQYKAAIKCCREALSLKEQREYEPDLYNTYGNVLNDMGQYDKALKVFDLAISKYPAYSLLYFNKGVVYMVQKRPADAEPWFQKALLINPYMYSAHYQLGLAALQQGKIVPAFLSFIGYLLVNPSGKYFSNSVNYLSQIAKSTDEILAFKNKRVAAQDQNYQDTEDILLSKIALDPAYKPIISIDDPISRQIQAVFEKLQYSDANKDFWIQYYLPYYKQVYSNGKFEAFIFHVFSNVNAAFVQNYVKKNKKELDAFVNDAAVYFNLLRSTRQLFYNKRDSVTESYLFDNGGLVGKGTLAGKGKILTGPWEAYYPGGNLKDSGNFDAAGGREGDWTFYFFTGNVKAKEHYKNGKLEGEQDYYFENGNLSSAENYLDNKLNGRVTAYYYAGKVQSIANYQNGKKEGEEKKFYSNGNLLEVNTYSNGLLTGISRGYFKSGPIKDVEAYKNGKGDGPYKSYYESGGISTEGQQSKDNAEGEWKFYYQSGKIKETHNYVNNNENGLHQEYFETGQLSANYNTKKGKPDGNATWYYKDGKPYSTYAYDNGLIKSVKYFNESGSLIGSSDSKDGAISIVSFSLQGVKKAHLGYDDKGNLDGADTLFYPTGKISEIDAYKDNGLNGPLATYYLNGKEKSEINMTDGKENGYMKSFYDNGQVESEGWMQNGDYQGEWDFYDEKGRLSGKSYYLNNDIDGYKEVYNPGGVKTIEEKYHRGWLEKMTQYDRSGNIITVDSFPKARGKYTLLYPNKKVMAQSNYVNGDFDGPYKTYYFDGSLESTSFYKRGLLDSTYVSYYYGGKKYAEGRYRGGNRTGTWKYYDEDGKLSGITPYLNDEINGEKIYYFPDGKNDFVSEYKDDELEGTGKKYDPDGTLLYQVTYTNGSAKSYSYIGNDGKLIPPIPIAYNSSKMKAWFANGKPSRECTYDNGIINGQDILYYSNGQVRSVDTSSYDNYTGIAKEYSRNGKLKSEYHYLNENSNGICREFNENGTLKKEITVDNGVNNGPVKYYDKNGKLVKTMMYYYGELISVKNE